MLIRTNSHIFDFAHINPEENKWFVLEVGKIERRDKTLTVELWDRSPAFLHFLQNREMEHYNKGGPFVLPSEAVSTKALRLVQFITAECG